jgi:uroporphyrinogen decarboxylase
LKDEETWKQYKKRLQPDPARLPTDEQILANIKEIREWDCPISISTGSMIGWIRDWMGVENLAYLCYDNPKLLLEMVNTIGDLQVYCLENMLPRLQKYVNVDLGCGWEDICFKTGPLISPEFFEMAVVPNYKKIRRVLEKNGIDLYMVDCDGLLDALLPLWLNSGVNLIFPIEIGAWNADPFEYRKKFGKQLLIYGGIDKRQLAKGRQAIDMEIERRMPLIKAGGFIPLPDHLIPPDVPLDDYKYYLEKMQNIRM